jgi:hypothetical protein
MWDLISDMIFFSLPRKMQWGCAIVSGVFVAALFLYLWLR